jgi:uncharacterized protein (TIGR02246 family)
MEKFLPRLEAKPIFFSRNGGFRVAQSILQIQREEMLRISVLAGCLAIAAAPAFAQSKATIQRLDDAWAAAFNKGDGAAVAVLYTPDATILPPGSNLVQGRKAIAAFWSQAARQLGDMTLKAVDVRPLSPTAAREIGLFTARTKGANPQQVDGKYVVVWRKLGGHWRLFTDIWNTNK